MSSIIRARRLLTEQGWREHQLLAHENGVITAIEPLPSAHERYDAEWLVPALIDTHVHGGRGVDVMDCRASSLRALSAAKADEGVGAFLATTVTAPLPALEQVLALIADVLHETPPGAEILGSYLEGPYFTPRHKGAHEERWFRELDIAELSRLIDCAAGSLKVVALAPEKPHAITAIHYLSALNVRVMLGHSGADYATTQAALDAGASGLVHCFNGMSGLHHRAPGMAGAGLAHPKAWLELIADGHHVHPAVLRLCRCCAGERLLLITDAMRAAGMPDGAYELAGSMVEMRGGIVRTASGSLAGSTLGLLDAVRNMVELAGADLASAIEMASLHPARLLGMDHELGSLTIGKRANVLALDARMQLQALWVRGRQVRGKISAPVSA